MGLFVALAVGIGVLVPPRSVKWLLGLVTGAVIAATAGGPWYLAVGLGLLALAVGQLVDVPRVAGPVRRAP